MCFVCCEFFHSVVLFIALKVCSARFKFKLLSILISSNVLFNHGRLSHHSVTRRFISGNAGERFLFAVELISGVQNVRFFSAKSQTVSSVAQAERIKRNIWCIFAVEKETVLREQTSRSKRRRCVNSRKSFTQCTQESNRVHKTKRQEAKSVRF